ncbi:insulinase family protein [Betaproteobacteria bacterium SCN2]|jgi:zinc protease|nr:insulinase family protein [Betaproteobacteria bacterium SCN2]
MQLKTVLFLFSIALPAAASVTDVTLDNGLRVIVKEDRRAPVAVSQLWYKAGSLDEHNGTTGVAHVLEHMMFKGTEKVPDGQFSKRIAAAGGRENAFTNRDVTVYFQQLQKDRLPLAFELEADRMANLQLKDEAFAREIQVVMEERRLRTEDNPHAVVYEQLMGTAFQTHPYRRPVIGWMNDLQNLVAQDARDWYRRWYAPNNATLVVAGDVNAQEVLALAKKEFGPLAKKDLPLRKPQEEPPQRGEKRIVVKAPAKQPYLLMSYRAPELRDVEQDRMPWAMQVLAGVLNGNDSARLNKRLVKEQRIAVEVGAGYDGIGRGPALFYLDGTPSQGRSAAELEKALKAEIRRIQQEGVSEAELNRVKAQVVAGDVYQRDSVFYQAMQLGELAILGLPLDLLEKRVDKLKSVTAEEVKAAARLLADDQLSVAVLDPQPVTAAPRKPAMEVNHAR